MKRMVLMLMATFALTLGCSKAETARSKTGSASPTKTSSASEPVQESEAAKKTKRKRGPFLPSAKTRAAIKKTEVLVKQVAGAVTLHASMKGEVPKNLRGLVTQELIEPNALKDAWAKPLRLRQLRGKGQSHEVCSSGPDHRPNTGDDICVSD